MALGDDTRNRFIGRPTTPMRAWPVGHPADESMMSRRLREIGFRRAREDVLRGRHLPLTWPLVVVVVVEPVSSSAKSSANAR